MRHRTPPTLATLLLAALTAATALAQTQTVPDVIHYQGKLMDGTELFTGVVPMKFRLYGQPTGGDWPLCESTNSVAVVDGYYTAVIGDIVTWGSLNNALFHGGGEVWLEVEIDGQVIEPREKLAAVPYARVAAAMPANAVDMGMIKENAVQFWHIGDSAVRGNHIQAGTVTGAKLATEAVDTTHIATAAVTADKIDWATMPLADSGEPRSAITNLPYTISQGGSYYLGASLTTTGNGITITADNVTLDLMGFSLTGDGGAADVGIHVSGTSGTPRRNVAVRNGTVRGFGTGILASHVDGCTFERLDALDHAGHGFHANALNGYFRTCVIADCRFARNGAKGVYLQADNAEAYGNRIVRCAFNSNGGDGAHLHAAATARCRGNLFFECEAQNNGGHGIHLYADTFTRCGGNRVEACRATGNGGNGVHLARADATAKCEHNIVVGCTLDSNMGAGVAVDSGAETNRIEDNTATANATGLRVLGAGNHVAGNLVRGNTVNYDFAQGNQLNLLISEIPQTLSWPCSVRLAGSLTGVAGQPGIIIAADDITVDLDGHALIGLPGSHTGVDVMEAMSDVHNIAIRNGTVREWGRHGVNLDRAHNSTLADLRAFTNGHSSGGGEYGGLSAGNNARVADCVSQGNAGIGIRVRDAGHVSGCSALGNGRNGIETVGAATVQGCTAVENGSFGFRAHGSALSGCSAARNGASGFWLGAGAIANGCKASWNTEHGFLATIGCLVVDCSATYNGNSENNAAGIFVQNWGNRIERNNVYTNRRGIHVSGQRNIIRGNTASYNTTANWTVAGANLCLVVNATTTADGFSGNAGGTAPDANRDPNANFTVWAP